MSQVVYRSESAPAAIPARALLAVTAAALALAVAFPAHADQSQVETRRRAYELGREAMRADQWAEAYGRFSELWREQQTYDVALNLGQVELTLRRYRDAAEHIAFALRHLPPREKVDVAQQANEGLLQAKQHIGTLKIAVDAAGVAVRVDGSPVGTSPIDHEVYVEPGPRIIEAQGEGYQPVTERVEIHAGEEWKIDVRMPKAGAPAASAPGSTSHTSVTAQSRSRLGQRSGAANVLPVILTGTVAAAGLGAGIGLLLAAQGKDSDRQRALSQLPGDSPCGANTPFVSECSRIRSWADDAALYRTLSLVSFGVVLAAGGATYALWPRSEGGQQGARIGWPSAAFYPSGFTVGVDGAF